jgi:hypothetical protein
VRSDLPRVEDGRVARKSGALSVDAKDPRRAIRQQCCFFQAVSPAFPINPGNPTHLTYIKFSRPE